MASLNPEEEQHHRVDIKLAALDRFILAKFDSHDREHELLQRAIDEFKLYLDAKLREMNEVRAQIDRERGMYPTHGVLDAKMARTESQIDAVDAALGARVKALELLVSNFQGRLWMLGATMTVIMFVLKIFWK